jgi:3-deoxy-7-phosphoheptulonate synthase
VRILFRPNATRAQIERVERLLSQLRFRYRRSQADGAVMLGVVGDTALLASRKVERMPGVAALAPFTVPYKQASREYSAQSSVVQVGNVRIGGSDVVVMAGPCSVESQEGLFEVARRVKSAGASILRGGAFKPRTSPYSFQGLGSRWALATCRTSICCARSVRRGNRCCSSVA